MAGISGSATRKDVGDREGTTKAIVAEQISQSVKSTSNPLQLMLQSSPSQADLIKLPKNLIGRTSTIKHTEQVLKQLPLVISLLDAYMENGLQSLTHLKTVGELIANIGICHQLKMTSSRIQLPSEGCKDLKFEGSSIEQ